MANNNSTNANGDTWKVSFDNLKGRMTEFHYLLLMAYFSNLNISQACELIHTKFDRNICPGRKGSPYTQELIDWGLVIRTNPGSSCRKGYYHKTTEKGLEFIRLKRELEDSLFCGDLEPKFG